MSTVSIVVPVYNTEKFLHQCLDSLIAQTYKNMEIICVDDGSTDRCPEILKAYVARDSRIKVFTKENEGKGAASARNLGMDHATGTYIQFLDSDDFFEPDMVEEIVQKMKRTNAEVSIFRANRFDNQKQRIVGPYASIQLQYAPKKEIFSYKDCPEHIFQLGDNVTWNKMYRTDFIKRHGLRFESIPISDDQYVPSLALVLAERITVIDKVFVNYRFNIGTSQVDSYHRHPQSAYLAAYSIVNKMKEHGIYEDVKKSYLNMALKLLREYYDRMTEYQAMRQLHEAYLKEVLPFFGAEDLPEGFFYDERLESWYRMIGAYPLDEILFRSARSYGSRNTTAGLRFQVPYDEIEFGSRIVLIGKGVSGRHWYAQLILSDYCDVVYWADKVEDIPEGLGYDRILKVR